MRFGMAALSCMIIAGLSSPAAALSSMPNGEGNPYTSVLAFSIVISLFLCSYMVIDRLERRIVEHMKMNGDVDGLIGALRNGWLAGKAACALGDIKDRKAVSPLVDALYDRDSDVRQAAAKALGDIGDDSAEGPLRMALGDKYKGVRDCASYALEKMHRPADAH
jgi:hypothetical protein